MLKKVVLISGGAAVGKTAVLKNIIPLLQSKDLALSVCKIDCVATRDGLVYQNMNIPHVVGISGDICPDHFLVSNLPELYHWADEKQSDVLLIDGTNGSRMRTGLYFQLSCTGAAWANADLC